MTAPEIVVREAAPGDVAAMCDFGARYVVDHYRPLIGDAAARAQVDTWWTADRFDRAVDRGQAVVAEREGEIVGVGERGEWEGQPVVWKLYVQPDLRGRGIGRELLAALVAQVPGGARAISVEHFAANRRAGRFYEREGFRYVRTAAHPSDPAQDVVWRERPLGA